MKAPLLEHTRRAHDLRAATRDRFNLASRRIDLAAAIRDADLQPPWRCHGIAADGYVTVVAGQAGEYKTWLTHFLAAGVQRGTTVGGIRCKQGNVVIFDAENGRALIGQRLKAAADMPIGGLTIYEADGLDIERDVDQVIEAVIGNDAQLVVIDSLRTVAPRAKENDSDAMAPVMGAIRRIARDTGAAVVVLHHRDKALAHDFRGSGAIRDQTDLLFILERVEQDPLRWRRRLRCSKCRIAQEPNPRWLGFKPWRGQLSLTDAAPATGRAAPKTDAAAEQALAVLVDADGPISRAEIARRLDRRKDDSTVRNALERLEKAGRAAREKTGWRAVADETTTRSEHTPEPPAGKGHPGGVTDADDHPNHPTEAHGGRAGRARKGPRQDPPTTPLETDDSVVAQIAATFEATELPSDEGQLAR